MQFEPQPGARRQVPGRTRILCVDDEPQVLEGLKLLLARHYEVHTSFDGAAALEALELQPFPVVICDMRMPGISGAEFLECAAVRWPTTVGILLSGARAFGYSPADRGIDRAYRILSKPCDPRVLRAAVAEGLSHHETLVRNLDLPGA